MLCKVCNEREVPPARLRQYRGLCSLCRTHKYAYSLGKKCIDCGAAISNRCTRCIPCTKRKNIVTRTCKECGIDYETPSSKHLYYCTNACAIKGRAKTMRQGGNYSPAYKGTPTIEKTGYVTVYVNGRGRRARVHTLIAEQILGRRLLKGECVHHINLDKTDNRHSNLIICDQSYHLWLHNRMAYLWAKEHLPAKGT